MTLLIAGYVLFHGFHEIPKVIHLLMDGIPEDINIDDVISSMEKVEGVSNIHHVHIRKIDEHRNALEAHVVLMNKGNMDNIKNILKDRLKEQFSIDHSTLEFENENCNGVT